MANRRPEPTERSLQSGQPVQSTQTGPIHVKFGPVDPASWKTADQGAPIPLQQHPVYGLALQSFGATALCASFLDGDTVLGSALVMHRKILGVFRANTLFRGPLWHRDDLSQEKKLSCIKALCCAFSPWRWNFLAVMPEETASTGMDAHYKTAGLRKIMTGFSTAWIDLRPEPAVLRASLKGKWRNQLVKAEKEKLEISIGGRKPHQYGWLLEKESEQRSRRRYQATPLGLVPAFLAAATPKSGCSALSVSALKDRKKVAGALFLLHGNSATYHIGWAGEDGRALNAQNRVLWEGMLALKDAGIRFLDLGGLNTAELAGIARFKLGTGATPITLAGTFI